MKDLLTGLIKVIREDINIAKGKGYSSIFSNVYFSAFSRITGKRDQELRVAFKEFLKDNGLFIVIRKGKVLISDKENNSVDYLLDRIKGVKNVK